MTVELSPLGTMCNLKCAYCYQNHDSMIVKEYNIDRIIETAVIQKGRLSVFGGEPLLIPIDDLEKIFRVSFEKFGGSGIQTNGTLITQEHVDLFKRYRVGVGVSIDGLGTLNNLRCNDECTNKIVDNIGALAVAGVSVSIITTIHQRNGRDVKFSQLLDFCNWLSSLNIQCINFHTLQGNVAALTESENVNVFLALAAYAEIHPKTRYQPFIDIQGLLKGNQKDVLCIWNRCDPFTTSAVYGIQWDCSVRNCQRIPGNWLKASVRGDERQQSLMQSDKEYGGCKGCRFFKLCGGGCPGEAIDGDWRNRTVHCQTYMSLFRFYENQLLDQGIIPTSIPFVTGK
jgi:uncharacterized protein